MYSELNNPITTYLRTPRLRPSRRALLFFHRAFSLFMSLFLALQPAATLVAEAAAFEISPKSASLSYGDNQTFTASGGVSPYGYSLLRNESGGTINASTGQYTAGSSDGTDIIRAADSDSGEADAWAFVGDLGNGETVENACMQDVYDEFGQGGGLNCTANDVGVATATNITIHDDGCAFPGDTVSFTADFEIKLTAQERHDLGIYFSNDGDPNEDGAYTGQCSVSSLPYKPDPPWVDLDGTGDPLPGTNDVPGIQDTCGDIDDDHSPLFPSITLTVVCIDDDNNNQLDLPYCTSWRQPGANELCTSPLDAFPGAPSKCNCDEGFAVDIPVPGQIIVDKVTDPSGDPQSFDFNLSGSSDGEPIDIHFSLTDESAPYESEFLFSGTYSIIETIPAGWELTEASCVNDDGISEDPGSIALDPGETVTCNFYDEKDAFIAVEKQTYPDGSSQTFGFQASWLGDGSEEFDFTLVDGKTETSDPLDPGSYSVYELVPAGWDLTDAYCSDGSDPAAIDLAAGESVTCTFENTKEGAITVVKDAIGGDGTFDFTSSTLGDFSLTTSGGSVSTSFDNLDPGTYDVSEVVPAGWELTNSSCSDGSDPGDIALDPGESVTCTFTNTKLTPALSIDKSASPSTYSAVGDVISYSFLVTNSGNVTLYDIFVVDDKASDEFCPDTTGGLAPGDSVTCSASYTITQADLDAGSVTNSAYAEAGDGTQSEPDSETVTAEQAPALSIDKSASPSTYSAVGDVISYSFLVTNSGNVTLYDIFVVDDKASDEFCPDTTGGLAPGDSVTCTASYTITQADLDAGSVNNSAYAEADDGTQSDPDSETVTAQQNAAIDIIKSLLSNADEDGSGTVSLGDTLTYQFVVTNIGNVTLSGVSVSDPLPGLSAIECGSFDGSLAPDESVTCSATYSITQADVEAGSIFNEATATGTPPEGDAVSDSDDETVPVDQNPALSIDKVGALDMTVVDPSDRADAGDQINYTITVTNSGDVTLHNVTVSDPMITLSCDPAVPATLAPGAQIVCTATYTLTQADIDSGGVHNTATADSDETEPVDDSEDVPLEQAPEITILKSVNLDVIDPGDTVRYTYLAWNTGNTLLTDLQISDDPPCSPLAPTGNVYGGDMDTLFEPGEAWEYVCYATPYQDVTNTATGSAQPPTGDRVSDTDTATVDVRPVISVEKTADPETISEPGGEVTFSITVTNESLEDVELSSLHDDIYGDIADDTSAMLVSTTCDLPQMILAVDGEIFDSYTCAFVANLSGAPGDTQKDIVTAAASDDEGNIATATDDATVSIVDLPSVIELVKSADPTSVDEPGDDVGFTFTVTNLSAVDSVTIETLTDSVFGDLNGQGDCAVPQTILAGGSYSCSITEFVSGEAGDTHTNLATASGTDDDGQPVSDDDSASVDVEDVPSAISLSKSADPAVVAAAGGSVEFTIVIVNTSAVDNVTINSVTDDQFGDVSGSCTPSLPATLAPGETITCIFTEHISGEPGGSHTNILTANGVDDDGNDVTDSDDTTVDFINPAIDIQKTVYAGHDDGASCPGVDLIQGYAGDAITYCFVVTNTGDTYLSDISGSDPALGLNVNGLGPLAPDESLTLHFETTITSDQQNTATATANPTDSGGQDIPGLDDVSDSDDAAVDALPVIEVSKTPDPATLVEPGGMVTFTVVVTNLSPEDVDLLSLTDDVYGDVTDPTNPEIQNSTCATGQTIPASGGEYTCSFDAEITGTAGDSVTDIVEAIAGDDEGNPASDTAQATVSIIGPICPIVPIDLYYVLDISGSMRYAFTGDGDGRSKLQAAKDSISLLNSLIGDQDSDSRVGLITFRGDGSLPISFIEVGVDVPLTNDITAVDSALAELEAAGSTPTSHAVQTAQSALAGSIAEGHLPVVFLISDGVPTVDQDLHGFFDADVEIVDIRENGGWRAQADVRADGVYYSGYDEYSGETLADVMVAIQDLVGAIPQAQVYSIAVEGHFFNPEILEYVADIGGGDMFFADDAAGMTDALIDAINQSACILDVEKVGDDVVIVGDEIQYTITVTNRGTIELTDVTLDDDVLGISNMVVGDGSLNPGESVEINASYGPTTEADVPAVHNTSYADSFETPPVFDDWTTQVLSPEPAIDLEKYVSVDGRSTWLDADASPGPEVNEANPVYFKFWMKNTGNIELSAISLTDTEFDAEIASQCDLPASLSPGEAFTCVIGSVPAINGQHQNTATVTGHFNGEVIQDQDKAHYFGVLPLVDLEKYVSVDSGSTWLDADFPTGPVVEEGSQVWFKFVISNNSGGEATNLHLTDTDFDSEIGDLCAVPSGLGSGESYDGCVIGPFLAVGGQHVNTATVEADQCSSGECDSDKAHYFGEALVCEPGSYYIKSIWPALVEIDPITLRVKDEDSFWIIDKSHANPYGDYAWALSGTGSASDPNLYFSLSTSKYTSSSTQYGIYAMDLGSGYASLVESLPYLSRGLAQSGYGFYAVSGNTLEFEGGGTIALPENIGGIEYVSDDGETYLLAISGVPGHQQVWKVPLDEGSGDFEGTYVHLLSINPASAPALYSYSYTSIAHGFIPTESGVREVLFVSKDDGSIEPWDLVAIIDYDTGHALRLVRSPDSGRILNDPITWPNGVTSDYLSWANPQGLEWIGGRLFLVSLHYWNKGPKHPPCVPAIEVTKHAPSEAVVGETVTYEFSVENVGDTPLFDVQVNDSVLGDLSDLFKAANGGWDDMPVGGVPVNFTLDYTVQDTDSDPLMNKVTASATYEGATTEDHATHSLDLVPPISIEKTGPDQAVIRDTVEYVMTLTNRGYLPLEGGEITDPSIGFSAVVGDMLFENHLFSGSQDPAWSAVGATGTWSIVEVENGNFIGRHTTADPSTFPDAIYISSGGSWTDYSVAMDLRVDTSNRFPGGVRARVDTSTGAGYSVWVYPVDGKIRLWKSSDWTISAGDRVELASTDQTITPGWHHLRLDLEGDQIKVYWDGTEVISTSDNTYSSGSFALEPGRAENIAGVQFDYDNLIIQALPASLGPDQSVEYRVNASVPEDAPDPLPNTASAAALHGGELVEDSDDHSIDLVEPTLCDTEMTVELFSTLASNLDVEFDGQKYYTARNGRRGNESASPVVIGDPSYSGGAYSTTVPFDFLDGGVQIDEGGAYMRSYLGNSWTLPLSSDASCRTVTVYMAVLHTSYYSQYSSFDISADELVEDLEVSTYRGARYSYKIDLTFSGDIELQMAPTRSTSSSYFLLGAAVVDPGGLPINQSPLGGADAYSVDEDASLNVAAPGVLANDADGDEDPITAVMDAGPASGELSFNPDGAFSYTPDPDFSGEDSFTYMPSDGFTNGDPVPVTITVNPLNDDPVAVDDAYSTEEDTRLEIALPGVLGNDADLDGDTLSAVLDIGPTNGALTLNADGSFTYTPGAEFSGIDTFQYVANDGAVDSNLATVTITVDPVDDPPTAADDSYTILEDEILSVSAPGVIANDSDPEGGALTATPVSTPDNGTLSMFSNGSFTYVPDPNFFGGDSFTYQVSDGISDSNVATVDITIESVNDAPAASDDEYSVEWETLLSVPAPGFMANDTDADGDPLSASLVDDVANGTLTFNSDGSFFYISDADFSGDDSFTYLLNDSSEDSNLGTVVIHVTPVNRPPVAVDDSATTDEDTPVNIAILSNDDDPDGDPLIVTLLNDPAHGVASLNADNTVTYAPAADFHGSDGFTYMLSDGELESGTASVDITVNSVNDPPVAGDDSYEMPWDTTLDVPSPGVLSNDTDLETGVLTATLVDDVSNGALSLNSDGSFSYEPALGFSGADSFTYRANDGEDQSNLATVTINVNAVNRPPEAVDDAATTDEDQAVTIDVLSNDSDLDGDPLSIDILTLPSHGTLTYDSGVTFTYVPGGDFFGSDSFEYIVVDGQGGSDTATVSLTVNPINDPPVALDDHASTHEGEAVTVDLLANDSDVDGDSLAVDSVGVPANGSIANNGDGTITYTPDAGFIGDETFSYDISDGNGGSDSALVTISVEPACTASISFEQISTLNSGFVVDFNGQEYYTARHEVRGNESVSPVVIGDFSYVGGDYDGRYVFEFEDLGDPIDDGGRYMQSAPGNQWSVPLSGSTSCSTVTFYVLIMHADFRTQASEYEIRAGDVTETLEVTTPSSARRSFAVSVTFGGDVEVEMEALYRSSDRIFMQPSAVVAEGE